MLSEFIFEHTTATTAIIVAVIGSLLLGIYAFRRYLPFNRLTMILAVMRLLFLFLLFWCLLLPSLRQATRQILKPRFLVAIDKSRSMELTPRDDVTTRWQTAREVLSQPWTRIVGAQADIDVYPFDIDPGNRLRLQDVADMKPDGEATHIRASLRRIIDRYRGQNVAGMLLLSDGVDTRETTDEWAGESWPFPIYTVRLEPSGLWEVEPDIRVDAVNTPRRVVVGWDTELSAVISGQGTDGAMIPVQLLKNDELTQEIPTQIPEGGGSREVLFQLRHDNVGQHTYTVNLPALEGETNTNDNFFSVSILVTDDRNRLLYVEGVPRWESKYINRVLQANTLIEPLSFVRGPDGRFLTYGTRGSMTTDMTERELSFFNILLVGDLSAEELGAERAENLVKFVEDGGSLILIGGAKAWGSDGYAATALQRLLPLRSSPRAQPAEGRFRVYITEDGLQHEIMTELRQHQDNLPPLLSYFPGGELSPGATALVEVEDGGERQPLVAVQRYGHGKVAGILTDSLWRWRLQPGADDHFSSFWDQMIAWAAPSETELDEFQLDLFADADQLFMGESITLQARMGSRDESALRGLSASCELVAPSGRRMPFRMTPQTVTTTSGRTLPGFAVNVTPEESGMYRAVATATVDDNTVESAPFSFYVRPFTPESNPRPINTDVLIAMAENSHGKFMNPEDVTDILSALRMDAADEERISFRSLWNNWWIMMGLILLLAVEWTTRKMKNMA